MKHLKLFENFEVVEPILHGEPLNKVEIKILGRYNVLCPELILKDDNYYYINDHRCENIKDVPLTYIHGVCSKFGIKKYTINDDYSIDVNGNIYLRNKGLTKIPLKFNKVSGWFDCAGNKLTTLEGGPEYVGGFFECVLNKLTTLEGSPKKVGGNFNCSWNNLTTLEGGPKEVGGNFYCSGNLLTTLEGSPKNVGEDFYCDRNQLTTLEGGPKEVGGHFNCSNNQLTRLEGSPKEVGASFDCRNNPLTSIEYRGTIKGKIIYR